MPKYLPILFWGVPYYTYSMYVYIYIHIYLYIHTHQNPDLIIRAPILIVGCAWGVWLEGFRKAPRDGWKTRVPVPGSASMPSDTGFRLV